MSQSRVCVNVCVCVNGISRGLRYPGAMEMEMMTALIWEEIDFTSSHCMVQIMLLIHLRLCVRVWVCFRESRTWTVVHLCGSSSYTPSHTQTHIPTRTHIEMMTKYIITLLSMESCYFPYLDQWTVSLCFSAGPYFTHTHTHTHANTHTVHICSVCQCTITLSDRKSVV